MTAQCGLAGLPVAWPCHWGPGPVAAFAVSERTDGVLLTLAYCGTCGKQPTRGNHALHGSLSTFQPTGPLPLTSDQPAPHMPPRGGLPVGIPSHSHVSPASPCLWLPSFLPSFLPVSGLLSSPNWFVRSFLHYLPPHSLRISDPLD